MKPTLVQQNIAWREVGEKPIWREFSGNKTCPREGEQRWIHSYIRSTDRRVDETIIGRGWLLYQPALSFFNGWEDHPEELDKSAIVEVEVLRLPSSIQSAPENDQFFGEHPELAELRETMGIDKQASFGRRAPHEWRGWAKVVVRRVVPFEQIPEVFPLLQPDQNNVFREGVGEHYQGATVDYHVVTYQEAHQWWITTHDSPKRIVLHCFEVSFSDPIEVWNWVLPD